MKSRTWTWITAITLFASLAIPVRLSAQGLKKAPHHYTVADLGTLGGHVWRGHRCEQQRLGRWLFDPARRHARARVSLAEPR